MKFLFDARAGGENLQIENEAFLHLKARRIRLNQRLNVRNLKDGKDYLYEVVNFGRKSADLQLVFTSPVAPESYDMTIGWAVVDPKTIEKTLPFLNELGIGRLAFIYTKFSQANFRLDLERFAYLCALSCEQCGRGKLMEFEIYKNLDEFLANYPNAAAVNFGGKSLQDYQNETLVIGPEGGFAPEELDKFGKIYALEAKNILKSQTAIVGVASKILL